MPKSDITWTPFQQGATVGQTGSENGIIVKDEEYQNCRITLEQCDNYHVITGGVYGSFTHTAFCTPQISMSVYNAMQRELQAFLDDPDANADAFYNSFASRY